MSNKLKNINMDCLGQGSLAYVSNDNARLFVFDAYVGVIYSYCYENVYCSCILHNNKFKKIGSFSIKDKFSSLVDFSDFCERAKQLGSFS